MKHLKIAVLACFISSIMLSGCDDQPGAPSSDALQHQQQETNLANAARDVGMPAVTNYTEKRLLKQLYEERDNPNVVTWTYLQGLDGRLTCLGQSVGYGIPYATQYSNPQQVILSRDNTNIPDAREIIAQAEPNGLFPPSSTAGTWIFLYDQESKSALPTYVEPNVTVSRFRLTGPSVVKECP